MEKWKNAFGLIAVGITIGAIATWVLFSMNAKPSEITVGVLKFTLPTETPYPMPSIKPSAASTLESIKTSVPTFVPLPPTLVPAVGATATPRPFIKGYVTISPQRETRPITLAAGELLVGTAVYFQDNFNQKLPPFTVFMIKGAIETDVTIENGGWDYWANVFDDSFAQNLLQPKIVEVQQHPDFAIRGYRIVRIP